MEQQDPSSPGFPLGEKAVPFSMPKSTMSPDISWLGSFFNLEAFAGSQKKRAILANLRIGTMPYSSRMTHETKPR